MRSKSGLHPYDAGIFFILRGNDGKHWPPISVDAVAGWRLTRMLAHMFDKPVREVAREIFDRAIELEEGEHGERQRQHDKPAA